MKTEKQKYQIANNIPDYQIIGDATNVICHLNDLIHKIAFSANKDLKVLAYQNSVEYFNTLSKHFEKSISTRLDSLAFGDTFKFEVNSTKIYKVIGKQDEYWIIIQKTTPRSGTAKILSETEVYPVKND